MNIVKTGNKVKVFSDAVETMKFLPTKTYKLCFSQHEGFYLIEREDMDIKEPRIYGKQQEYLKVIFEMFNSTNRNLGVLVSGAKGTGKTLFMKNICQKGKEEDLPVIIIDRFFEDLIDFLDTIENRCIVVFDEFEKTHNAGQQNALLGLFDGMSKYEKMFILTVNSTFKDKLSEFLLNRPGRIHYHLSFSFPSEEEIFLYLKDNVEKGYWGEITKVIDFSRSTPLNYDSLRAISKELNLGRDFDYSIKLLNIKKSPRNDYMIKAEFEDGGIYTNTNCHIPYGNKILKIDIRDEDGFEVGKVSFSALDAKYDPDLNGFSIPVEKIKVIPRLYRYADEFDEEGKLRSGDQIQKESKRLSIEYAKENGYPMIYDTKLVSLTYSSFSMEAF